MVYRTFKQWRKRGKVVRSGCRATARTRDGEALFSNHQVVDDYNRRPQTVRIVETTRTVDHYNGHYGRDDYHSHTFTRSEEGW